MKARLVRLGSSEKYQRLISKDLGSVGIKSGHVILRPGENIGGHSTGEREEVVVVLKGKGEATIDKDSVLKMESNTVLYVPPETEHDIQNTGHEMLEYVFITSKA